VRAGTEQRTHMPKPAPIDKQLAQAVRRLRMERGLTQEELAFKTNLTVAAVGRIERADANPQWSTLKQIAAALDLTIAQLAAESERPEKETRR
jgi:transcriptional regulator with XRE-family HTH domain